jgi:hypothetical protein
MPHVVGEIVLARLGPIQRIWDRSQSLLAGAQAGEHYFLVCVLGHCGDLANVIPHKYVLSTDARLVHGFDGLEQAECQEKSRLDGLLSPSIEDSERCDELHARGFPVNLETYRAALAESHAWSCRCAARRSLLALPICYWNLSLKRPAQLAFPKPAHCKHPTIVLVQMDWTT